MTPVEIDELGDDIIRFRCGGVMESVKFLRDGDRLYFLHRGLTRGIRDLTLAAPQGVPVEVCGVADGAVRLIELAATPEPVMALARMPRTVLALRHAGVPIDVVDLGGMGAGPGRRRLHKTISVSSDELRELLGI